MRSEETAACRGSGREARLKPGQVLLAPLFGRLDRVERVEVDVEDLSRRVRGVRGDALEQAVRPVEPARAHEPGDEPDVLRQESMGVRDPDPGADRQEPMRLRDTRDPDVDGQLESLRPTRGDNRKSTRLNSSH